MSFVTQWHKSWQFTTVHIAYPSGLKHTAVKVGPLFVCLLWGRQK